MEIGCLVSSTSAGALCGTAHFSGNTLKPRASVPHSSKDVTHLQNSNFPGRIARRAQFTATSAFWRKRAVEAKPGGEIHAGWIAVILLSFVWCHPPSAQALVGPLLFETLGLAPAYLQYDFVSDSEKKASQDFSLRVSEAVALLEQGKQAQARGDFAEAFQCFDQITTTSGDLALAEYARVGRAISRYEIGDRAEAIIEMEDSSISLKGYPEVHAALAAVLYVDKHAVLPAEHQFTIATLMDSRYTDPSWVEANKHWPPSLVTALRRFISLQ